MQKVKSIALILGVLAMSLTISYLVLAFTEPTSLPPGGNVSAPVNVGTQTQYKTGALGIGGLFITDNAAYLATVAGNVGIGTTSPTPGYKLDVRGEVIADDFCLRSGGCLSE